MSHSYFLTILKYRTKFCRFILCINLFICIIILIYHDIEDKTISNPYENITKDLINNRLKTHARFFNESSSSSCNTIETLTIDEKQNFNKIIQFLTQFHQQNIPLYSDKQFNGRGIVLTIDRTQISQCKINLKMIEYIQTRLPVQIWYSSSEISTDTINELLHYAPKLQISVCSFTTSQCQTIDKIWNLNRAYVFSPSNKWKYFSSKSAAIISSTFREVLFLDTDSYLVRDPEYLFQYDPMYKQFGALFFPDALITKQSLAIWKLLNITCNQDELEFDSGALLVNKKQVWKALYMAKLINDQYEIFQKLFSKGYKDTFRLAFRFLHVKYYMVGIPCSTGHYDGTHFCGFTTCKTDSLGQYIFINHLNLMKYIDAGYSSYHLSYTRIGLGDPYNHSFYIQHCQSDRTTSCLLIGTQSDEVKSMDKCMNNEINQNEIDDYVYGFNEPLKFEQFQNGRMLMSETNNLMPGFVGSLFHYRRQIHSS